MLSLSNNDLSNEFSLEDSKESINECEKECPYWPTLPSYVIENIYTYLDRKDRLNMSLVCKNWATEYGSPGLWKTFTFHLHEHDPELEVWPEVKFAQKFGCMFRHVEIVGKLLMRDMIETAYVQLQSFLDAVVASKCQLISLKFKNTYKLYQFLSETEYHRLFNSTINFLKSQRNLRVVEFHNTFYQKDNAAEILNEVFEHSSSSLTNLVLRGFVRDKIENVDVDDGPIEYVNLMQRLMSLHILTLDYSQFFEGIVQSVLNQNSILSQNSRTVKLMEINCEGSKRSFFRGISPNSWKALCRSCPELKIRMNLIYSSQLRNHIDFYLAENIPLEHLDFRLEKALESPRVAIGDLLQRIIASKANLCLKYLSIVWMPAIEDISTSLIPFLLESQKLKTLQLFLRHPVGGIEPLFEYWLENRPVSLESVHISITRVNNEADQWNIAALADEYCPLFQIMGINLMLLADSA